MPTMCQAYLDTKAIAVNKIGDIWTPSEFTVVH